MELHHNDIKNVPKLRRLADLVDLADPKVAHMDSLVRMELHPVEERVAMAPTTIAN